MITEEDISQLIGNYCNTPTLKTPRTVSEDVLESPGTTDSLFRLFEMEHTSPILSKAMDDQYSRWDETSSLEEITSFVHMLKSNSDRVKLEAASALLHVLSINHASTVVECGAIPALLEALECPKQSIRDECVKCISAIVSFSAQLRDHVIQIGGLSQLLQSIDTASSGVSLNTLLRAISMFFSHDVHPSIDSVSCLLPFIVDMLNDNRESTIIVESCKVLSLLADGCPKAVRLLLDLGTKRRLMHLMNHEEESVVVSALRTCRYLVAPKEAREPHSKGLPVSPIRLHKATKEVPKNTSADLWKISPLMASIDGSSDEIQDIDILVCQNVEMFKASKEDISTCSSEGALILGQIGLRCMHCGTSPFTRAKFSTVFPGSIGSIAASLRHMTIHHFTACLHIPDQMRAKMLPMVATIISSQRSQINGLENFCSNLCQRTGVQNRYPSRSGISLSTASFRDSPESKKMLPIPMRSTSNGEYLNMPVLKKPKRETSSMPEESDENSLTQVCEPVSESFVQVEPGIWRCIICLTNRTKRQSGIWKGCGPPPLYFKQWHGMECHREGSQAHRTKTILTSSNIQRKNPVESISDSKCDPVVSNNSDIDQDDNSLCSDTTLVQEQRNTKDDFFKQLEEEEIEAGPLKLIVENDKLLVTEFMIFVMDQMEVCYLEQNSNESNKGVKGSRNGFPQGFPGIRCKHCVGTKHTRQFFWSSPDRFKNNNSEFSKHLMKCRSCPSDIKEKVSNLKTLHNAQMKSLPKGGQFLYFKRLFKRLHNTASNQSTEQSTLLPPLSPFSTSPQVMKKTPDRHLVSICDDSKTDDAALIGCLGTSEDPGWLDVNECILRKNVEFFCLSARDIRAIRSCEKPEPMQTTERRTDHSFEFGQVGVRCLHCSQNRACQGLSDSTSFKLLNNVDDTRDACQELRQHFSICSFTPKVCKSICEKAFSSPIPQTTHQYYRDTALESGLYNDNNIVRFSPVDKQQSNELPVWKSTHNLQVDTRSEEWRPEGTSTGSNMITPSSTASGTKRPFEQL